MDETGAWRIAIETKPLKPDDETTTEFLERLTAGVQRSEATIFTPANSESQRSYARREIMKKTLISLEICYFAVNNCSFTRTRDQFFSLLFFEPFPSKKKAKAFYGYAKKTYFFHIRNFGCIAI